MRVIEHARGRSSPMLMAPVNQQKAAMTGDGKAGGLGGSGPRRARVSRALRNADIRAAVGNGRDFRAGDNNSRSRASSDARLPAAALMRPATYSQVRKLARPRGFEPLTPRSVVWCSIQLSYGRPQGGLRGRPNEGAKLLASPGDGKVGLLPREAETGLSLPRPLRNIAAGDFVRYGCHLSNAPGTCRISKPAPQQGDIRTRNAAASLTSRDSHRRPAARRLLLDGQRADGRRHLARG